MNDRKLKYIDLFAGAGGLSEGFVTEGTFFPVAHVEMNVHAADTLKTRSCYYYLKENKRLDIYKAYVAQTISRDELYNSVPAGLLDTIINEEISSFSIEKIFSVIDSVIKEQNLEEVDLIIGGPPCQAFSLLGRAVDANNMQKDQRNYLYKHYVKFLKHYQPKAFVFENVPGILTAGQGKSFKKIIGAFRVAGYNVDYRILNAFDYGVLQQRKRVIIFGWRHDMQFHYPTPVERHFTTTVNSLFEDLPALSPGESNVNYKCSASNYVLQTNIRQFDDELTLHSCRPHNQRDLEIYAKVISAWNSSHIRLKYSDLPEELGTRANKSSFLDRYKVVAGDIASSHTMIAHIARDGHYFIHPEISQCRSISVREAARIQSFPDNFYFEGPRSAKFAQIGNAVPPLMAQALATSIANMFKENGEE